MRIYIVDDSEILRSRLVQLLSGIEGIEVSGEAGYVQDAIREIKNLEPDVVIIDLKMKDGTGIDVLTAIKNDRMAIKAIVFTNYPYLQYRKRSLDAGADFFFYKATDLDKLLDLLKDMRLRQRAG